jgi:hypothetical protein
MRAYIVKIYYIPVYDIQGLITSGIVNNNSLFSLIQRPIIFPGTDHTDAHPPHRSTRGAESAERGGGGRAQSRGLPRDNFGETRHWTE